MSTGYPDFARLQAGGGYELASQTGDIASGTILYQGSAASWPYVNLYTRIGSVTDWVSVTLTWWTDDTYTLIAGQQTLTRGAGQSVNTQYAVLAPWLTVVVETQSGSPVNFLGLSVYGSYGRATARNFNADGEPIGIYNATVAATSSVTSGVAELQPGPAALNIWTAAAAWNVYLSYRDFGSALWRTVFRVDDTVAAHGGTWPVPMLDAPYELTVQNNDTAGRQFVISWVSAAA